MQTQQDACVFDFCQILHATGMIRGQKQLVPAKEKNAAYVS